MSTTDRSEDTRASWNDLPTVVTTYLTSRRGHDISQAMTAFVVDAMVNSLLLKVFPRGPRLRGRCVVGL